VGKTWEKLFFSWEKLGTFDVEDEGVTFLFGNFVGITIFFVGKTWEKVGEKGGKNWRGVVGKKLGIWRELGIW